MASRDIPEYAKRAVRQRCGFGCIFCGAPVYDYDHIEPFAQTGDHDPSNLTLLCPNHHREKTAGRLHSDIVRERNEKPFNKRSPLSVVHDLHFRGRKIDVKIGGTWFSASLVGPQKQFSAVIINERRLCSFFVEDGKLLLSLVAHDEYGSNLIEIDRSELRHSTEKWDVQFSGNRLAINDSPRRVILELLLHPPAGIEIRRAYFTWEGYSLTVVPTMAIGPNGNLVMGGVGRNLDVGFTLGRNRHGFGCGFASWG